MSLRRQQTHFEQATRMVTEDDVAEKIVCGPDPDRVLAAIGKYRDAGYDHLWLHQVGPDQQGFFRFFEKEVLPGVARLSKSAAEGRS